MTVAEIKKLGRHVQTPELMLIYRKYRNQFKTSTSTSTSIAASRMMDAAASELRRNGCQQWLNSENSK